MEPLNHLRMKNFPRLPKSEICEMTAAMMRTLVAQRELSPVEIVEEVLRRADALQPHLNCFITLCHEQAMEQARQAEQALMRGEAVGMLHGLPFTVKDIVDTANVRTTYGSLLHRDHVPAHDALAVARVRQAGGILIGKTTSSEFGAKCMTDAPLFGTTRNAWDPARTSGGSSGGAAAAMAAGIAPLAIATDGGGSTRIPAACNGVVGLKQSLGVVPHSQVQDAFGNYTYVTPTTRNVGDTALMLQAMTGAHGSDPWSLGVPAQRYFDDLQPGGDLRGKRILFSATPAGRPIAADVAAAFEAALATLRSMGAELEEMSGEGYDVEPVWRVINHTSWRGRFAPLAEAHADQLSPSLLQQLALVEHVDGVAFQQAMFARTALFRKVQAQLETHDFIFTPTLSRTALPIDQDLFGSIEIDGQAFAEVRPNWFPWTMPFNLTGHPAISLPCGAGSDGLPIGMQLVGRFREDLHLLQAASAFEANHRPANPLPVVAF
ncbi:aspartyl-tRNA(Asn)/glutamyl-tRNA(Gln) amidotransferase subunit A [Variovorax sp. OK212]|nr:aspartyl-tRNA(Asn)/glutamyl-tRNA(Gln) amidotransferase subunit A [Variovorax sp. OK202]SFD83482.1 aspartyl-tRNA(Asn)/glutamyl-tRNA(Gln) amidotransferase subunit A [Variovorax sp. OK212]